MKIGNIDTNKKVLVIAEIGNNHEGSYLLAEEMIGLAAKAGAHAVKFQTIRSEYLVSPQDNVRFATLKRFELSSDEFERLAQVAHREGVMFLSTPFDLEIIGFINGLVPAFKVASGDNTFYPLLETIAELGKPIFLSTGLADLAQLKFSKALIEKIWQKRGISQEIALLHCVCSYPVPSSEANLSSIALLKEKFDCTVGYSDHTLGINAAILSVALGARIIEKHFTLNRNHSDFRDHQFSADPELLREMVTRIGEAQEMLGDPEKQIQNSEAENIVSVRRSIAAKRDIVKGKTLLRHDIVWLRPGDGLIPGDEALILGKKAKENILAGTFLRQGLFE